MRLFYNPGTSSLLPHMVLNESGLAFQRIKVDEHTKMMETGGDYRTVNPLGYVPALHLDDGTVLTEAAAIAQYIADRVPAMRLAPPNGTLDRTKLQSWLNFISAEMQLGCFCPLFHPKIPESAKAIFRERLASRLAHESCRKCCIAVDGAKVPEAVMRGLGDAGAFDAVREREGPQAHASTNALLRWRPAAGSPGAYSLIVLAAKLILPARQTPKEPGERARERLSCWLGLVLAA
jgi:hypothetical protein